MILDIQILSSDNIRYKVFAYTCEDGSRNYSLIKDFFYYLDLYRFFLYKIYRKLIKNSSK
jgi:hypothetical protein